MNNPSLKVFLAGIVTVGLVGCGSSQTPTSTSAGTPNAAYLAASEPAGAVNVGEARTTVTDKQQVVLVGRIGGSTKPFIDGLAAFTIVDSKVPHCAPEEGCPTPWDYCCEQHQMKDNIATVKIVDAQGKPVAQDARQLLGVKELSLVVVSGTAQRDADGNFAVLADQVFIK